MSLKNQALNALTAMSPLSRGSAPLVVTDGAHTLRCDLEAVDALACAFSSFQLEAPSLAAAPLSRLESVANDLSKRLTYLLEPICPIEIDADRCVVQMRSVPPSMDDDATTYYELLVGQSGTVSLARYRTDPATGREPILAQVTREVFGRLVDDFAGASG